MALTVKQRDWARRVYSYSGELRCHFVLYSEERGFYYCGSTERVEINHIKAQGWCRRILHINPDFPRNLIAICKYHFNKRGGIKTIQIRWTPTFSGQYRAKFP